jgi:hypothetical protein
MRRWKWSLNREQGSPAACFAARICLQILAEQSDYCKAALF